MTEEKVLDKLQYNKINGPFAVAFTITRKCNYRCIHCYNESGESRVENVTQEDLLNIADQISELQPISICLCGGETLLDFETALKIIKRLAPNCGCINMVSNGYFATKQRLQKLKDAGLHTFQVSLDGNNDFTHDNMRGVRGAFVKAIEAINMAKEVGLTVAVSFVPQKLNYLHAADTCDLCYKLGVSDFRVMPLLPMGRGNKIEDLLLSSEEMLTLQRTLEKKKIKYQGKMIVQWGDPIDHLYRMPNNAKLNIHTYSLEVDYNGDITVTSYLPMIVGNCNKYSLSEYWDAGYKDIWGNEKVLDYIKHVKTIYDFSKEIYNETFYISDLDEKLGGNI